MEHKLYKMINKLKIMPICGVNEIILPDEINNLLINNKEQTFELLNMVTSLKEEKITSIDDIILSDDINELIGLTNPKLLKSYVLEYIQTKENCIKCTKYAQYINVKTNDKLCWSCCV
jgi:hypothetical protein